MTQPHLGITPKVGYFHCSFFCKIIFCAWRLSHTQREQYPVVLPKEKRSEKKSSFLWDWLRRLDWGTAPAWPCPAQLSQTLVPHSAPRGAGQGTTCPSCLGGTSAHVLRTYLGPSLTYQAPGVLVEWMVFSGAFNSVRCVCGCFNQQIDINRHLRLELFIRSWVPNFLRYF